MNTTIENLEMLFLIQTLKEIYNVDFSNYREAYLLRRIHRRMDLNNYPTITTLTNYVMHDKKIAKQFIQDLSINVTNMFRCPEFYQQLIKDVFPILKTYPIINIWHAGCSSGEEVLSMAILLKEYGLYEKCNILATDNNTDTLKIAQDGVYNVDKIKQWTQGYTLAGGRSSFADYYNVKYNLVTFSKDLFHNITYQYHDLTSQKYPSKMHLILCRNVLIYFNASLQKYVIDSLFDSLVSQGFLGLGEKESINHSSFGFKTIHRPLSIFQKE